MSEYSDRKQGNNSLIVLNFRLNLQAIERLQVNHRPRIFCDFAVFGWLCLFLEKTYLRFTNLHTLYKCKLMICHETLKLHY